MVHKPEGILSFYYYHAHLSIKRIKKLHIYITTKIILSKYTSCYKANLRTIVTSITTASGKNGTIIYTPSFTLLEDRHTQERMHYCAPYAVLALIPWNTP